MLKLFSEIPSSIVHQTIDGCNGLVPNYSTIDRTTFPGKLASTLQVDGGGFVMEEPWYLMGVILHKGSGMTVSVRNIDSTADINIFPAISGGPGYYVTGNILIPAKTILQIKTTGATVVEVIGKIARSPL